MDRLYSEPTFTKALPTLAVREQREGLLRSMFRSVRRHRGLVTSSVVLALLAVAAALAVLEKKYAAEAIVQLDLSRRESALGLDQPPAVMLDASAVVQSEARIIRSRTIARQVVERLGLAEDPRYASRTSTLDRLLAQAEAAVAGVLPWLNGDQALAPAGAAEAPDAEGADTNVARAVRDVLKRLAIGTDNRSYLITVTYTSGDAVLSARIANAFAEEYLRRRMQSTLDATSRTTDWLGTQIRETSAALREAETSVAALREQTGLLEPGRLELGGDAENVQQQQLRGLISQLNAAGLSRLNEERRLARVQELLRTGSSPSAADLQGSPLITLLFEREAAARRELGEMLSRLGSRHPSVLQTQAGIADITSRIASEVRRAVSVISGDLAAARSTEEDLKRRVDDLRRTMIAGKSDETELRNRQAHAQAVRDRLAVLRRSNDQALAAQQLQPVTASIAMPAEPEPVPSSPKPVIIIAVALIGGLGAGVAAATLADKRDQGFRTSGDIRPELDLRCLGMVPELPKRALAASALQSASDTRNRAAFDEAIYAVGAGVGLFDPVQESRIVLVTSSVPAEGKSTICIALAQTLAAAGQRVVVINAKPNRNGGQPSSAARQLDKETPPGPLGGGGTARLSSGGALVVIDSQNTFPFSADTFRPGRLSSLLQDARKHFDVILVEGPPIMLVADSLVLGRLADTVIHVARWADTRQEVVEAALRRLREHSIVVDGLVLARVDLRRHARLSFVDECSFYLREKGFYERLASLGKSRPALPPDAA